MQTKTLQSCSYMLESVHFRERTALFSFFLCIASVSSRCFFPTSGREISIAFSSSSVHATSSLLIMIFVSGIPYTHDDCPCYTTLTNYSQTEAQSDQDNFMTQLHQDEVVDATSPMGHNLFTPDPKVQTIYLAG